MSEGGISPGQLLQQVVTLEDELAGGHPDEGRRVEGTDPGRIESVASPLGFEQDAAEIGGDRRRGVRLEAKSVELGVATVAARLTGEDLPREQSLAPEGNQATPVQVAGVKAPESQSGAVAGSIMRFTARRPDYVWLSVLVTTVLFTIFPFRTRA